MADINPTLPAIDELNSTADPKIRTALQTIVATVNNIETANLADDAVTLAKLADDAAPQVYRGGTGGNTSVPATGVMTTLEIGEAETSTGLSTSSGDVATAAGGLYLVTATVDFQSVSTETYRGVTLVGSTAGVFASSADPGAYGNTRKTVSGIVRLAAAETVTVKAAHNSGAGSRNVNVHNFGMVRLSA